MHDSMKRLQEVAKTDRNSDISRDLNVGASTVANWSKRGVSKEGALAAAAKYDSNANYILDGVQPDIPSIASLRSKINAIQNGNVHNAPAPLGTANIAMAENSDEVPILSWVAAGSWSNVDAVTFDDAIGRVSRPKNLSKNGFALIVRGESMLPKFDPEDIIYVEPQTGLFALKNNDLVIVQCNEDTEATFKQLVLGEKSSDMYLRPLNPNWHEQKMMPMGDCNLVGKVVGKYVEF